MYQNWYHIFVCRDKSDSFDTPRESQDSPECKSIDIYTYIYVYVRLDASLHVYMYIYIHPNWHSILVFRDKSERHDTPRVSQDPPQCIYIYISKVTYTFVYRDKSDSHDLSKVSHDPTRVSHDPPRVSNDHDASLCMHIYKFIDISMRVYIYMYVYTYPNWYHMMHVEIRVTHTTHLECLVTHLNASLYICIHMHIHTSRCKFTHIFIWIYISNFTLYICI